MTDAPLQLSVVICAFNPNLARLSRVLQAIARQRGNVSVELLLIDNVSQPALTAALIPTELQPIARVIREETPGLSHARARGFQEAQAPVIVLVDDDNLLTEAYFQSALTFLAAHPEIDLIGGPCEPEFDCSPDPWTQEFHALLAIRNFGEETLLAPGQPNGARNYPSFAPTGAGMVLRRSAALTWLESFRKATAKLSDRQGTKLSSAGDNDIVLTAMNAGSGVAYVPSLHVTHLLSASRLEPGYLARLNEGIQRSWMQVLSLHGVNPWPPISAFGATLRIWRAYWRYRAWRSPIEAIRFAGAKGHFLGRKR